jgi:hypothetical protein
MRKKTYHIVPKIGGQWIIKEAGPTIQTFKTQKEAIRYAKTKLGKYGDIVVHKKSGGTIKAERVSDSEAPPRRPPPRT